MWPVSRQPRTDQHQHSALHHQQHRLYQCQRTEAAGRRGTSGGRAGMATGRLKTVSTAQKMRTRGGEDTSRAPSHVAAATMYSTPADAVLPSAVSAPPCPPMQGVSPSCLPTFLAAEAWQARKVRTCHQGRSSHQGQLFYPPHLDCRRSRVWTSSLLESIFASNYALARSFGSSKAQAIHRCRSGS